MAAKKKKKAAKAGRKLPASSQAEARKKASARKEAARKGWETRRAREEEARKEAERKAERRKEAARKGWETRKAREEEARREEARKQAALEKKRARDRRYREKKRQAEAGKRLVCGELLREPSTVPEIVWGSACFTSSKIYHFSDGSFEGEIIQKAGKDHFRAWSRIEKFTSAFWKSSRGYWMRIGVFGSQVVAPGTPHPRFDADRYKKGKDEWGRFGAPGSLGNYSGWVRVGPTPGKRTRFRTAAQVFLTGRKIAQAFYGKGLKRLLLVVQVFTGRERPA
jgi:hypothetical protein